MNENGYKIQIVELNEFGICKEVQSFGTVNGRFDLKEPGHKIKLVKEMASDIGYSVRKKKKGRNQLKTCRYERFRIYKIEEVLPFIVKDPRTVLDKKELFRMYHGFRVRMTSLRYRTFLKSLVCADCGIEGRFFALERHLQEKHAPHLNLYATDGETEILMTKDHILPKSKGGKDSLDNLQTMCIVCNNRKGNIVTLS